MRIRILLPLLTSLIASPALAVFKCEADGKVTYSDTACAGGKRLDLKDRVPESDARQATLRARQQKAELDRIDALQRKEQAQQAKVRNQIARANARQAKKCDALAKSKQPADDAIATAPEKSITQVKAKARQAGERHAAECSSPKTPALFKVG